MEQQKTKWLHARLSQDEYDLLIKRFKATSCRKLSQYIRAKLFDEHLVLYHRNKSLDDFMTGLMQLRTGLGQVGNNFNQAVRKLNSMPSDGSISQWIFTYESNRAEVIKQIEEINIHLKKFSEQWLQNSLPDHP